MLTQLAPDLAAVIDEARRRHEALAPPPRGPHPRHDDLLRVRAQLPPALRDVGADELAWRCSGNEAIRAARVAWRPPASCMLIGPTGVGKTSAAAWWFRRLVWLGGKAPHGPDDDRSALDTALGLVWAHVPTLERQRGEWPLGRGECPELRDAERASVLFLDELGWEREPQWLAVLLDARYSARRPVFVTSSLTSAALAKRYPGAVMRRIVESGEGFVLGDAHANPTRAPQ